MTVVVNPRPTLTFPALSALCANSPAVTLGATPSGGTYSGTGVSGTVFNPAIAGVGSHTITYSFTDANGCSNTINRTITVNPLPSGTAGSDLTICAGQSTVLSASGGSNYQWTALNGNTVLSTSASVVVSPTSTSSYVVRIANSQGCTIFDTVQVSVTQITPVTVVGNTVICSGGSTILTAAAGYNSYLWTPSTGLSATNIANPVFAPTTTTTYTVIATNVSGCNSSSTITVTVLPRPVVNAGQDQTYCGSPIQLQASGASYYQWSNLATGNSLGTQSTLSVNPGQTTQYLLSGTDLFGCVGFDTVTVFVPNASAGLTRILCAGDSVQLTASLFNAQPGSGVSYSWSSSNPQPGIMHPASANTFVKPATSGTYTYTVQITSSGCTFNSSVNVIVLPRPTINLGSNLSIAPGATISITPSITGTSSTTTYQWSFLSGQQHGSLNSLNSMNTQFIANSNILSLSTVGIVLSAINPSGCTNTDTLMITIDPSLQGASLSGQLVYDNSTASPLGNGKVFLQYPSGGIDSATVSGSGSFLFNGLQDSTYKLSGITYQTWGGVTVSDAAIINNNVTNPTLVGLRLKAADVTGDGLILSNDAQQTAMRASELPISFSFDNNGPGNWAYDTTTVNIAGSNVVHNPKAISYGDVDGSYSPVLRRSGTMILESIGELNLKPMETTAIPIRLSQNAEIGSFQIDIQIQPGDEIVGANILNSNNPVYFNKISNETVRVLWYSGDGIPLNLQAGETLLWINLRKSNTALPSSDLKLIGYNEINNGWVQPYHSFRLQAPRLIVNKNSDSEVFKLFPNPVNEDILHVELLDAANSTGTIKVTDMLGRVIYSQTIEKTTGSTSIHKILTNSWGKGQYHFLYLGKSNDGKPYQISKPFTVR